MAIFAWLFSIYIDACVYKLQQYRDQWLLYVSNADKIWNHS